MTLPVAALAVLAKPTGIILGPILSAYLFWKTRRFWLSLLPGFGSAIGLAVYFIYNYYRFENFRTFGQPWAFSVGFVPQGLAGLLISPGAGLLWFCPCVMLSAVSLSQIKTKRLEAWTIAALAAASLLLHSLWASWSAGWSWGTAPVAAGPSRPRRLDRRVKQRLAQGPSLICRSRLSFDRTKPSIFLFSLLFRSL